jgi:hypothetical protein
LTEFVFGRPLTKRVVLADAGLALLFPPPTNATNQPLDWTTYKPLIFNRPIGSARGLRAFGGDRGGEKNALERVKTAKSGRPRENSKSTGTRTNPRKHVAVRKKRPTR